jgi:hypothetical protein
MNRVEASKGNATLDHSDACTAGLTTYERLKSFGRTCKMPDGGEGMRRDIGLQKLMFDYGRYLLAASSWKGSQPANLVRDLETRKPAFSRLEPWALDPEPW